MTVTLSEAEYKTLTNSPRAMVWEALHEIRQALAKTIEARFESKRFNAEAPPLVVTAKCLNDLPKGFPNDVPFSVAYTLLGRDGFMAASWVNYGALEKALNEIEEKYGAKSV